MTKLPIIPRQLPIFDQVLPDDGPIPLPYTVRAMRERNGANDAHACGTCILFASFGTPQVPFYKCAWYRQNISADMSPSTDWRADWPACGLGAQADD